MRLSIIIIFLLYFFINSFSQSLKLKWVIQGKGLSYANVLGSCTSSSNHIYITGFFLDSLKIGDQFLISRGSYDIYLAKFDTLGNLLWFRQMGGIDNDGSRAVTCDYDNNVYVTGYYWKTAQFGDSLLQNNNIMNFFLTKYDSDGNFIWVNTISSTNSIAGYDLICDQSNNIYCTGYLQGNVVFGTNSYSCSSEDVFLSKFNKNGQILWSKIRGGNQGDYGISVTVDSSGYIYSSGTFLGTAIFDSQTLNSRGLNDVFVEKTDSLSNQIWIKHLGSKLDDSGFRISFNGLNDFIMSGTFQDTMYIDNEILISKGNKDVFLIKCDLNGLILKTNSYGGTGSESGGKNVLINNSKKYLMGSNIGNSIFENFSIYSADLDPFLLSLDEKNAIVSAYSFNAVGIASTSFNTIGNSIYVSGYFDGYNNCIDTIIKSSGNKDIFLIKLNEVLNNESALPIELTSFKIICTSTGSLITFSTASETNNNYFTVEKTSDLKEWKLVGSIYSEFDSKEIKDYEISDNKLVSDQLTYYRLKQTDKDGKFKYYDVSSILCHLQNNNLEIIGINISNNAFNVIIKTNGLDSVYLNLTDISGKLISQKTIIPICGANTVTLNTINLLSGTYLLTIVQNNTKKSKKIFLN